MTALGDKTVCRRCGGVLVAMKNPTVVSLTAGVWVHASALRRLIRSHAPQPWGSS